MSTEALILVVIALVSLVISVIALLRTGGDIDTKTAMRLEDYRQDRQNMARLEQAFQEQSQAYRDFAAKATPILDALAKFTPIKTDDAAMNILKDIQDKG